MDCTLYSKSKDLFVSYFSEFSRPGFGYHSSVSIILALEVCRLGKRAKFATPVILSFSLSLRFYFIYRKHTTEFLISYFYEHIYTNGLCKVTHMYSSNNRSRFITFFDVHTTLSMKQKVAC